MAVRFVPEKQAFVVGEVDQKWLNSTSLRLDTLRQMSEQQQDDELVGNGAEEPRRDTAEVAKEKREVRNLQNKIESEAVGLEVQMPSVHDPPRFLSDAEIMLRPNGSLSLAVGEASLQKKNTQAQKVRYILLCGEKLVQALTKQHDRHERALDELKCLFDSFFEMTKGTFRQECATLGDLLRTLRQQRALSEAALESNHRAEETKLKLEAQAHWERIRVWWAALTKYQKSIHLLLSLPQHAALLAASLPQPSFDGVITPALSFPNPKPRRLTLHTDSSSDDSEGSQSDGEDRFTRPSNEENANDSENEKPSLDQRSLGGVSGPSSTTQSLAFLVQQSEAFLAAIDQHLRDGYFFAVHQEAPAQQQIPLEPTLSHSRRLFTASKSSRSSDSDDSSGPEEDLRQADRRNRLPKDTSHPHEQEDDDDQSLLGETDRNSRLDNRQEKETERQSKVQREDGKKQKREEPEEAYAPRGVLNLATGQVVAQLQAAVKAWQTQIAGLLRVLTTLRSKANHDFHDVVAKLDKQNKIVMEKREQWTSLQQQEASAIGQVRDSSDLTNGKMQYTMGLHAHLTAAKVALDKQLAVARDLEEEKQRRELVYLAATVEIPEDMAEEFEKMEQELLGRYRSGQAAFEQRLQKIRTDFDDRAQQATKKSIAEHGKIARRLQAQRQEIQASTWAQFDSVYQTEKSELADTESHILHLIFQSVSIANVAADLQNLGACLQGATHNFETHLQVQRQLALTAFLKRYIRHTRKALENPLPKKTRERKASPHKALSRKKSTKKR